VAQAVDGFGAARDDWSVAVENVAIGMGQIAVELVEGRWYVARAVGLGFANTTTFTAKCPQMVVHVTRRQDCDTSCGRLRQREKLMAH